MNIFEANVQTEHQLKAFLALFNKIKQRKSKRLEKRNTVQYTNYIYEIFPKVIFFILKDNKI